MTSRRRRLAEQIGFTNELAQPNTEKLETVVANTIVSTAPNAEYSTTAPETDFEEAYDSAVPYNGPMSEHYLNEERPFDADEIAEYATEVDEDAIRKVPRVLVGGIDDLVFLLRKSGITTAQERLQYHSLLRADLFDLDCDIHEHVEQILDEAGATYAVNVRPEQGTAFFDAPLTIVADAYRLD